MDVLQGVTIALLVVALLGGVLVVAQRRGWAQLRPGSASSTRQMVLVERLALSPQHSLHLVRVNGRLLLISNGPGGSAMRFADDEGES